MAEVVQRHTGQGLRDPGFKLRIGRRPRHEAGALEGRGFFAWFESPTLRLVVHGSSSSDVLRRILTELL
jgi:hypothetical protein